MANSATTVTVESIELNRIKIPDTWGKREQKHENIEEMTLSLGAVGMIEPVVVRKVPGGSELYELIDGRHRMAGAELAGWTHVPAVIKDYNDTKAEQASLAANLHRYDYETVEYDAAIARWKELYEAEHGPAQRGRPRKGQNGQARTNFNEVAAQTTGDSKTAIKQAQLRYKKQAPEVKAAREAKKITTSQTDELIRLPPEQQVTLLSVVEGKSLDATRQLVNEARDGIGPENPTAASVVASPESEEPEPQIRLDDLGARGRVQAEELGQLLEKALALLEENDLASPGGNWAWVDGLAVRIGRVRAHVRGREARTKTVQQTLESAAVQPMEPAVIDSPLANLKANK